MIRRGGALAVAPWLLLALALGLRVWKIDQKNLWLDEAVSWEFSTSAVSELVAATKADVHPPLYYVVLKAWVHTFGESLTALRGLSVLASLAALILAFRLSLRCVSPPVALIVMLWIAVSPHAIYFSQEARMYALSTALVLGFVLAYRAWVDSNFTRRAALVAYVLCAAAALYVHYFTVLAIVALWGHAIVLLALRRRATSGLSGAPPFPIGAWLLAHVAIAVIYAPWVVSAIAQMTQGQPWRQAVVPAQIPFYAGVVAGELTLGFYVPVGPSAAIAMVVLGAGLGALVLRTARYLDERDVFTTLVALAPVGIGLALLPLAGHMQLARYVAYAGPLVVIGAARGFEGFRLRPIAVIAVMTVGLVAVFPSARAYYTTLARDTDPRPVIAYLDAVASRAASGPSPVFVAPGFMISTLRYATHEARTYQAIANEADLQRVLTESTGRTIWIVFDYRWPGFSALPSDPRLVEVTVPESAPYMIRLFRVGPG